MYHKLPSIPRRLQLGESLLEVAAAEGRLDCAALLIEHRADVNHTNKVLPVYCDLVVQLSLIL